MREKTLEQRLVRAVKEIGGIAYKFISPGHSGVPDRLVVLPEGRIMFIEVKTPGQGRLSAVQRKELKRLHGLGAEVYVLDSPELIERILDA